MRLNRELQIKILEYLAVMHPCMASRLDFDALLEFSDGDKLKLAANLLYLEEHNYLFSGVTMSGSEAHFSIAKLKILKDGQDFLLKDGGLIMLKNTVTVRFHEDAVALIESCISKSPLTPQDKRFLLAKIQELPASAIEHLMKKLLDTAVQNLPDALQLIKISLL